MKYLNPGNRDVRLHPELVERFNELVRYNFDAARTRGKDPHEIKRLMREADLKEQEALLKGPCEIQVKTTHERHCSSNMGGMWYAMPCDCSPTKRVVFAKKKDPQDLLRGLSRFYHKPIIYDEEGEADA